METLKKDTYCVCCDELMKAGNEFRWEEKQVQSGSKVGSYRTVYRPAHIDRLCGGKKLMMEESRRYAEESAKGVKLMREHGLSDDLIQKLKQKYIENAPWPSVVEFHHFIEAA